MGFLSDMLTMSEIERAIETLEEESKLLYETARKRML